MVYPFGRMGPVQTEPSRPLQDMARIRHIYKNLSPGETRGFSSMLVLYAWCTSPLLTPSMHCALAVHVQRPCACRTVEEHWSGGPETGRAPTRGLAVATCGAWAPGQLCHQDDLQCRVGEAHSPARSAPTYILHLCCSNVTATARRDTSGGQAVFATPTSLHCSPHAKSIQMHRHQLFHLTTYMCKTAAILLTV